MEDESYLLSKIDEHFTSRTCNMKPIRGGILYVKK